MSADELKTELRARGMTVSALAALVGVTEHTVRRWLRTAVVPAYVGAVFRAMPSEE